MSTAPRIRAFLALPHYGQIIPDALPSLTFASLADDVSVNLVTNGASLLAHNFNFLWCNALNDRAERGYTHFAMHHADLAAPPGWLDMLLAEMDRVGADIISAVVPIKDQRGLSSTAMQDPESLAIRRLTMHEIHRLPETFEAKDLPLSGQHLLVNTGLWVCRFDLPWVETFPGFTIRDQIVKNNEGRWQANVLSEDWGFSGWAAREGLKVWATRKVKVHHFGGTMFPNTHPWGEWQTDRGDNREALASIGQKQATTSDVEGWLTDAESTALAQLATGKIVLEIGSYKGRSTVAMATVARQVHAVDWHNGDAGTKAAAGDGCSLPAFVENIARAGVREKVVAHVGRFEDVLPLLADSSFDLAFIDGAHDDDSVRHDLRQARRLLVPGGVLAFHDWNEPSVRAAAGSLGLTSPDGTADALAWFTLPGRMP
jgi:SAM-dependent methyltransferase